MPRWLAPNVITLLGILAIYANIVTILIYVPDLSSSGPSWIYFSFAFSLFFYQTMDNIDGKQARATGSSSPLGELFDHGIDSLNCCLGGLVQSVCMGMGSSKDSAFITFITCVAMYLSTWETYHTHVLYLGYLNGPTEGIIIIVITMLISAIKGVEYWNSPINEVFPAVIQFFISYIVPPSDTKQFADRPIKDLWIYIAFWSVLCFHVPVCLFNVYKHKQTQKMPAIGASAGESVRNHISQKGEPPLSSTFGSSSATVSSTANSALSRDVQKTTMNSYNEEDLFVPRKKIYSQTSLDEDSFLTALLQLVPLTSCATAVYVWLASPYSTILSNNHLVLFTLTISLVFGRMTTTIILAHLTRQPFPYWSFPMYPLFAGAILFRFFSWPSASASLTVGSVNGSSGSIDSIDDIKLIPSNHARPAAISDGNYFFFVNFELIYLWLFFLYMLAYFSVYSTRVIKAITEFLGISAFTIRKPVDLMEKDS